MLTGSDDNGEDDARGQAEHRIGVRKRHYGQADVFAEQQGSSLRKILP